MSNDFLTHSPINRNQRKLNLGVNIIDVIEYPFTTNADIQTNQIRSWRSNPFGVAYYNTLNPPSNMRVIKGTLPVAASGAVTYALQDKVVNYEVTQNQTSTKMYAERLASKTKTPFYAITSDILQDQYQYFGGNKDMSARLPIVSMVNRSQPGSDFYSDSSNIEYIIKKRLVINNIVVKIFDNMGNLAPNISPYSSIIFRVERMYQQPAMSIPFSTIEDYENDLENKNKNKNKK